jgi:GntR family transcriptional regulator, transcriptional repressor for pyruvate dehydrogenase complex
MKRLTRPPLHKEIAETLSEQIVSGKLPVDSLLPPERELCETFGVSRTVIREAVKLLESRGLARVERGRGTVVKEAQHEAVADSLRLMLRRPDHAIEELLEVRKMLEAGMVTLAAERRTPENLARMERTLEVMRQKPGEPEGYVDADVEFHAEIARAAHNRFLLILLDPFAEFLRQSRIATFAGPRMVKIRTRQHEAIFEMIRRKDPERARTMMLKHLSDTQRDLERHNRNKATRK